MENQVFTLNRKLNTLSIFRNLLKTPVVSSFQTLVSTLEKDDLDSKLTAYGDFVNALYKEGGDLGKYIEKFIMEDENFFLIKTTEKAIISRSIVECLNEELTVLQELANITTPQVKKLINYVDYLPLWDSSPTELKDSYYAMLEELPFKGYGIFAKYTSFKVKNGTLIPVKNSDPQSLDTLYGYTRERNQVLENTRALVEGKPASNVLLYGDAGTGKSSTIKACANAFANQGLRLIEFNKSQLSEIPDIIDALYGNPLKFIFYIDDLSFSQNDDSFCLLKGILEGNVTSYSGNIAIYATSNRRHLIKESMDERMGSELHLSDTLQETMSLAARFGLTITFSKPEKDLYLEIVKSMADEWNIQMDESELFRRAEAFAIRSNGRSPRTAKQFIHLLNIGLQ